MSDEALVQKSLEAQKLVKDLNKLTHEIAMLGGRVEISTTDHQMIQQRHPVPMVTLEVSRSIVP